MRTRPSSGVRRRWPWPSRGTISPRLAYAEYFVGLVCQCRRDVAATQAHADALLALAAEHRLPLRAEQGRLLRGWALAMQGEAAAGVAHLRQALASPDVGPEYAAPLLARLAGRGVWPGGAARGRAPGPGRGRDADGHDRDALVGGRGVSAPGGVAAPTPQPDVPQAEACFQQALDVARRQQAKALELRAALSLGRLWQQQGKREEARTLLAPIYGWFTEGFDTVDLQDAKALLEALA